MARCLKERGGGRGQVTSRRVLASLFPLCSVTLVWSPWWIAHPTPFTVSKPRASSPLSGKPEKETRILTTERNSGMNTSKMKAPPYSHIFSFRLCHELTWPARACHFIRRMAFSIETTWYFSQADSSFWLPTLEAQTSCQPFGPWVESIARKTRRNPPVRPPASTPRA